MSNFLRGACLPSCPLLLELVKTVINLLANLAEEVRNGLVRSTIASFMWTLFKQTRHFANGQMSITDSGTLTSGALIPEWTLMSLHIAVGSDFPLVVVPKNINGLFPLPRTPSPYQPKAPHVIPLHQPNVNHQHHLHPPQRNSA